MWRPAETALSKNSSSRDIYSGIRCSADLCRPSQYYVLSDGRAPFIPIATELPSSPILHLPWSAAFLHQWHHLSGFFIIPWSACRCCWCCWFIWFNWSRCWLIWWWYQIVQYQDARYQQPDHLLRSHIQSKDSKDSPPPETSSNKPLCSRIVFVYDTLSIPCIALQGQGDAWRPCCGQRRHSHLLLSRVYSRSMPAMRGACSRLVRCKYCAFILYYSVFYSVIFCAVATPDAKSGFWCPGFSLYDWWIDIELANWWLYWIDEEYW